MPSLLGNNFLDNVPFKKVLESFYGIGNYQSSRMMAKYHIFPRAQIGAVPQQTLTAMTADLTEMTIESKLLKKTRDNIKRLRDMGSYRGRRHAMGLPVRGQTTRTQIYTARKLNKVERYS